MVIDGSKQQSESGEEMNFSGNEEDGGGEGGVADLPGNGDGNDLGHQTSTSSGDSSIPALISPPNRNPCHNPASDSPDGNNEVIVVNADNLQNDGSEVESVNWSQASTVDIATVTKANTSSSSNEGNITGMKANASSSSNEGNKTATSISSESSTAQTLSSSCSVLSSPKSSGTDTESTTRSSEILAGRTTVKETQFGSSSVSSWSLPDMSPEEVMFGVGSSSRKPLASTPTEENSRVEFSEPLLLGKDDDDDEIIIPPSPNTKSTSQPPRVQTKTTTPVNFDDKIVDDCNRCCGIVVNDTGAEINISELANQERKSETEPGHPLPIIEHPNDNNFLGLQPSVDDGRRLSITEITDNNSSAECSTSPIQVTYDATGEVTVIFETSDEDNKDTPPKQDNAQPVIDKSRLILKNHREKETQVVPYVNRSMSTSMMPRREDLFAPLRLPDLNFQRVMQDIAGPSGFTTRNIPCGEGNTEADSDSDSDYVQPSDSRPILVQNMKRHSPYFSKKGKGRGKRSKPSTDNTQSSLSGAQNAIILPYPTTTEETTFHNSRADNDIRRNSAGNRFGNRVSGSVTDAEERMDVDNADNVEMNDILDEICAGVVAIQNRFNRPSNDNLSSVRATKGQRPHGANVITNDARMNEKQYESLQLNRSKSDNPINCVPLVNSRLYCKSPRTLAVPNAVGKTIEQKKGQAKTRPQELGKNTTLNPESNATSLTENLHIKNSNLEPNSAVTRKVTTIIVTKKVIEEEITCGGVVVHKSVREVEDPPRVHIATSSGVVKDSGSLFFEENRSDGSRKEKLLDRLQAGGLSLGKQKQLSSESGLQNVDENNVTSVIKTSPSEPRDSDNSKSSNNPSRTDDGDHLPPTTIGIGSRVMAKWSDGCFYSGRVCRLDEDERWIVEYDDGNIRPAFGGIVAVDILPEGLSIFAKTEDSEYFESGVILSHEHCGADLTYTIAFDSRETKTVSRSAIMMTMDQVSCLNVDESQNIIAPGINLGNIVASKRRHKKLASPVVSACGEKTAKSKNEDIENKDNRMPSRKRKQSDAANDNTPKNKQSRIEVHTPPILCSALGDVNESSMTPKLLEIVKARFAAVNKASTEVHIHRSQSLENIFGGKQFLLTEAPTSTHSTQASSSQDSSPNSTEEFKIVFSRPQLSTQISSSGGTIISDVPAESNNNVYLISNTFVQTGNYLKALAMGIPCVSHVWITDCCRANSLLPYKPYLLPAGISLLTGQIVEWHGHLQILSGCCLSVFLSNVHSDYGDASFWINILRIAGAEVYSSIDSPSGRNVNAAIIDDQCPIEIRRRLTEMNITMVSIDWVIQCLINGRQLSFQAHEKFTFK